MITTKTGDKGQTTCGNKRVDKDDLLVEAIGTIDELQSNLGVVRALIKNKDLKNEIFAIQKDMHGISGELACGLKWNGEDRIKFLEKRIEETENSLPKMTEFLVPGENIIEAQTHVCRTVARRTERRLVALNKNTKLNQEILKYFNRLSDYLFMIARTIKN